MSQLKAAVRMMAADGPSVSVARSGAWVGCFLVECVLTHSVARPGPL
jgi:hypothetical protein